VRNPATSVFLTFFCPASGAEGDETMSTNNVPVTAFSPIYGELHTNTDELARVLFILGFLKPSDIALILNARLPLSLGTNYALSIATLEKLDKIRALVEKKDAHAALFLEDTALELGLKAMMMRYKITEKMLQEQQL
jgi:hypothetical protein